MGLNKVLDRWYWTKADVGIYTIDAGLNVASSFYNYQQLPQFYMARGNQVLINEMDHFIVQGSGNNTSPGGHNYPSELTFLAKWYR